MLKVTFSNAVSDLYLTTFEYGRQHQSKPLSIRLEKTNVTP